VKVDVLPGDQVETLAGQVGLVVSVDLDGYVLVLGPTIPLRTFYGKYLRVLTRMPEEAGAVLESAFRLGGLVALSALRDKEFDGEPGDTLRLLLVDEIMVR
jgi:hypothetical protein